MRNNELINKAYNSVSSQKEDIEKFVADNFGALGDSDRVMISNLYELGFLRGFSTASSSRS